MLTARYFNAAGESADTFELPQDPFNGIVHEAALHQVIKAHLANRRQGTASTKTRGEVSGGKRKAWRQKGTGRARQGSIRAPHWRGGGVAFGPSPRSYHQDVPKKVKALGRRSAFNSKALAEQVAVIERFELEAARTRLAAQLLKRMEMAERKLLLLTDGVNESLVRATRNLQNVRVLPYRQASAYDVMRANQLVIEAAALPAQPAQPAEAEGEVVHA
jgi:large subunit ribosomal protein L4